ncbi:MAG: hypothetical protein H6977_18295 [Gammaproteobacteria bacterium]|nr:hypothetical protein [Gammaproteobacteria bacterium]MCP5201951.1 hypothetical protein [Gammaproteobacteria bacterium]
MISFETLLRASGEELFAIFAATRVGPLDDADARREQIAQHLGLKEGQLLCGIGFNPAARSLDSVCRVLGYADIGALATARNFAFIHDVYRALSINNVLEIYGVLGRLGAHDPQWSDLVLTRVSHIEAQLEETINPILIGGYKLEIRAIYEQHLASPDFVRGRLSPDHAVMRDVTGENVIMLETGAVDPLAFLQAPGVAANEKRRVIFQGAVPPAVADHYIRSLPGEDEQRSFREALAGSQG